MTDLETVYAYPPGKDRWVRANMVTALDGFATLDQTSKTLSGSADTKVLGILRALCDVVLVGAGTARAENYKAIQIGPVRAEIRARQGLSASPPIAVVTRTLDLDLSTPLFTQADARTIVATTSRASAEALAAAELVADLIVHDDEIDLALLLDQLAERGLHRVLSEGGPGLLTDLLAAGLVDELCLTVSPTVVGDPGEHRLLGPVPEPVTLELAGTFTEAGFVFLRYLVQR
jgi:riboflavin biosynthesis pyrimidine reductase